MKEFGGSRTDKLTEENEIENKEDNIDKKRKFVETNIPHIFQIDREKYAGVLYPALKYSYRLLDDSLG